MAKLIPALILLFCFSALLSSSHARSLITSPEDESTDLKPLILLPTDNFPAPDTIPPLVNEDEKISSEMKSFEKPTNRRFERLRAFKCRHGHGGDQIRPGTTPFWKEGNEDEHHHHLHHHHGEVDPASVEGEGRMIGEFKEPHFFFGRHHHHRHHHDGDEEHEEREHHHRHGRGHGFWKSVRKFLGRF